MTSTFHFYILLLYAKPPGAQGGWKLPSLCHVPVSSHHPQLPHPKKISQYLIHLCSPFYFTSSSSQSKASRPSTSTESTAMPRRWPGSRQPLGNRVTPPGPLVYLPDIYTHIFIHAQTCKHTHIGGSQASQNGKRKKGPTQERRKCPPYICRLPPVKASLNTIG